MPASVVSSNSNAQGGTTLTITKPASIVAGNLLFVTVATGIPRAEELLASTIDVTIRDSPALFTAFGGSGHTTLTVPASTQTNDLMVVIILTDTTLANTTPAGWTQRATDSTSDHFLAIYTRVAGVGEGGTNYDFGGSGRYFLGFTAYYSYAGGTVTFDACAISSTASSVTSLDAPSITTSANNAAIIAGFTQDPINTNALSPPSGNPCRLWGTDASLGETNEVDWSNIAILISQATAGATPTQTFTSNHSHPAKAYQIALKSSSPSTLGEGWISAGPVFSSPTVALSMLSWYKVATSSEPASYVFRQISQTAGVSQVGAVLQIGSAASSPIDVFGVATEHAASTSIDAASITTLLDNDLVVGIFAATSNTASFTAPANMTQVLTQGGAHSLLIATRSITPAGATGTESATLAASSSWSSQLIAIASAMQPPPPPALPIATVVLPPYQSISRLVARLAGYGGYDQAVGNFRETQVTSEVVIQGTANLRETQVSAEVTVQDSAVFRLTQDTVDATVRIAENYHLTQATMDVLIRTAPLPANARLTQSTVEVLIKTGTPVPPIPPPPVNPTTNNPPQPSSAILYALDRQVFEPLQQFQNTVRAAVIEASQTGVTWAQLINPWSTYTAPWDSFASQDQVGVFIGLDDGMQTTWADLPLPWSSYPQSWNSFPAGGNVDLFSDNSTTDAGLAIPYSMVPALVYESSRQDILLDSWDFILKIASFFELLTVEFDALKQPLSIGTPITASPISLNDKSTFSVSKAYPGPGQSTYSRYIRVTMSGLSFARSFAFAGATIFVQILERPSR